MHPLGESVKCIERLAEHRASRPRHAIADDEPRPQADPEYEQMDVEHQVKDDAEAMEEDVDDGQTLRGKRVVKPDPKPLDDYPGGPHNTTLLTRYHVHVAKKAFEGEVPINVIL